MRVILVNGSPDEQGCTFTALSEVASALEAEGVKTDIFQTGKKPIQSCLDCGACHSIGRCVVDDIVYDFAEKAKDVDGFVFGSPVHYAAGSGQLASFMGRLFFSGMVDFAGKPAAAVVSCRRGGASATFDQINKFFGISGMITVGSQYWNSVHGRTPEETRQDLEGMQTMRTLGRNMAWILKCIEAGKNAGIEYPEKEPPIRTNFIREI